MKDGDMADSIDLRQAITDQLRSFVRSGMTDIPRPKPNSALAEAVRAATENELNETQRADTAVPMRTKTPPARDGRQPTLLGDAPGDAYGPVLSLPDRTEVFRILNAEVAECKRCPDLVASRSRTVFGVGTLQPRLCFFGEAPGADEDRVGEPFVGAAGQLLNKIIAACKLTREEVYILNAIKCRPHGNRTPTDSEIENCRGYMERQLEVLQPEFICCLGAVAVRSLLQQRQPISRMRQQFFRFRGSRVLVTYHPSYLLREPSAKRLVWEDMQLLMKEMGVNLT